MINEHKQKIKRKWSYMTENIAGESDLVFCLRLYFKQK